MSDIKEEGYKVGDCVSFHRFNLKFYNNNNFPLTRHLKPWLRWLRSSKDTGKNRRQRRQRRCSPTLHFCVYCPLFLNLFLSFFALPGINAQYNSIFEFKVKNAAGKETFWVIDLKKFCEVKKGEATSFGPKADVTIILTDETFMDIAEGRTTAQKAFLTGGVKTRGNMLLGLKLDGILKVCQYCLFGHAHMTNCACHQEHEGKGEAVNCGPFVVSAAARHTYHRLIAILKLILCMVMCRE